MAAERRRSAARIRRGDDSGEDVERSGALPRRSRDKKTQRSDPAVKERDNKRERAPADRLVRAAVSGDEAAWQELVRRYVVLVCSICRRCQLSETDTAHVTRLVLTRALGRLPELAGPGVLPAWVAATTRRECVRVVRNLTGEADPADSMNDPTNEAVVRAALARLPEHCRRMVGLERDARAGCAA